MTYKTYAVTTVVTDNELAKHLSWSSHLKRNYQKKQNVLQAPETWTEPNCTKYCETSILAPSAKYPAYIYIYALEKIILTVPGKNKTHRISIARQPQEEKQIESWGGRHVGKVLGQPKKKRNGEWKGNKTGGKVEKMWSWGRLSKLDVDICEVSTCEAVRSALIRALVDQQALHGAATVEKERTSLPCCS